MNNPVTANTNNSSNFESESESSGQNSSKAGPKSRVSDDFGGFELKPSKINPALK